jgi:hypothetical protein
MAKLFVKEYPWFYISVSVHKIMVHEADIVSGAILLIGQLSEETPESRNKDLIYSRRSHSRKISQSSINEEGFNVLLVSLDPLIWSVREIPIKATKTYLPEALKLLAVPKEWEDLSSSDSPTTDDDSHATSDQISNKFH